MPPQPTPLRTGEKRSGIVIRAREKWNHTGVTVSAGERYSFDTQGTWSDMGIRRDGNGFSTREVPWVSRWLLQRFESKRRVPSENWFCLIGSVDENAGHLFRIGRQRIDWVVEAGVTGELVCFANDVESAYWNNIGSITLTIARTA
jgi:hypothetical protein